MYFLIVYPNCYHQLNKENSNYNVGNANIDTKKYNIVSYATDYVNALNSCSCNFFIEKSTRITASTDSCLDYVYSNLSANNIHRHILLSDMADHYAT